MITVKFRDSSSLQGLDGMRIVAIEELTEKNSYGITHQITLENGSIHTAYPDEIVYPAVVERDQLRETCIEMLAALELCHTRLFNYQAGMDEIRDQQATKELNAEAIDAARAVIEKARKEG